MATQPLRFADAEAWRAWLDANHATAEDAIVFLTKKAVPRGLHYEEALAEALCYGWIDGRIHAHDAERFTVRFSPRRPNSIWSESNRRRARRLVREGRVRPAGLARIEEAKRSGAWDSPVRPMRVPPMPKDLREALRAKPEAWANFRAWGASYRSACIRWVVGAKTPETRERRIRRVVFRASRDERPGLPGF